MTKAGLFITGVSPWVTAPPFGEGSFAGVPRDFGPGVPARGPGIKGQLQGLLRSYCLFLLSRGVPGLQFCLSVPFGRC